MTTQWDLEDTNKKMNKCVYSFRLFGKLNILIIQMEPFGCKVAFAV